MARVKRAVSHRKRRKRLLKQTKGFKWGRKSQIKRGREAIMKAWSHSYYDRRKKKGAFRRLWNIKINAGVRPFDLNYSRFINLLKKKNVVLDRKILAGLAEKEPTVFEAIVKRAKE